MSLEQRSQCTHQVLFYTDDQVVYRNVAAYIAGALRQGEPALVIARPALMQQITIALHRQHVQGHPFGPTRGELVGLDAAQTLDSFCVGGSPEPDLFRTVVGSVIRPLASKGKRVAAYGEMVAVLCERGQYADAVRLEAMWNELLAQSEVTLVCAYPQGLFSSAESRMFYQQIVAAHTHVHGDGPISA